MQKRIHMCSEQDLIRNCIINVLSPSPDGIKKYIINDQRFSF